MTTTISGTTGCSQVVDGSITQGDLAANVAGNGPAFLASGIIPSMTFIDNAATTVLGIPELIDTAGCYDAVTGRFTPNVAGFYQVSGLLSTSATTLAFCSLRILSSGVYSTQYAAQIIQGAVEVAFGNGNVSGVFYCNGTTDYIHMQLVHDSSANKTFAPNCAFSAFLARSA